MALFIPSVTQVAVLDALNGFLLTILPSFTQAQIVVGQENLVAEPELPDFIVMTPLFRNRLSLDNPTTYSASSFTGSIAGPLMTVSAVPIGAVAPGNMLFGVGVAPGSIVGTQASGAPGGAGTYAVTPSQTLGSTLLASGSKTALQAVEITIQLDVHGPASFDNSGVITAMFRDSFASDQFNPSVTGIAPLYPEDAVEMTFENDSQQIEQRWVVAVHLQANPLLIIPQQFAINVTPTLYRADEPA